MNGHSHDATSNGSAIAAPNHVSAANQVKTQERNVEDTIDSNASDTTDTSIRFEAMSQEREALRAEVEQLRKSLQDIQGKHTEEVSTIRSQHSEEISGVQTKHSEEILTIKDQHTEEISSVRAELEESQSAREQAEEQYQSLLGRINTIKASLGERLKADRQELAEAKEQIEELESQNESLQGRVQGLEADAKRLESESQDSSRELSSLRNRHNLSQQNWVHEREDLMQQTRQLRDEAEAAKEAMGDWEVLAMEERAMREGLTEKVGDLEEQFSAQKDAYETAVSERDSQFQSLQGLQRALQEVQEARKRELRDMVESYEEQIQSLKKLVQDSDSRAIEAENGKGSLQTELNRLAPFEKEVKEKNLLIGKLRHEAIVLNDHLTKALRFLKKAKPEDNIDRYVLHSTNTHCQLTYSQTNCHKPFPTLPSLRSLRPQEVPNSTIDSGTPQLDRGAKRTSRARKTRRHKWQFTAAHIAISPDSKHTHTINRVFHGASRQQGVTSRLMDQLPRAER